MEKDDPNQKKKSIIAKTRRTKTKGNKMKEAAPNKKKTKKIHHNLNPANLNQRQ